MKKIIKELMAKLSKASYVWRYVLAAILICAGVLKLLAGSQPLLAAGFQTWPAWITRTADLGLPWFEIALGLWLISGFWKKPALAGALVLVMAFIASNLYGLVSGASGSCHCLGNAIALTHGQSLAADLLMLAMGVLALMGAKQAAPKIPFMTINRRFWPAAAAALVIAGVLTAALPSLAAEAGKDPDAPPYPVMRPTAEQLAAWENDYQTAPLYSAVDAGSNLKAPPPVYSLLDYIDYIPAERNQGYAGNCWVWAGTGLMEIANTVSTGTRDRLSIQYLDSNYYHAGERAGCGGDLTYFANFYNGDPAYNQAAVKHIAVPWSNSGGNYADYYLGACNNISGVTVSTTPNYPVLSNINALTIPTAGLSQDRAIANIKSALLNKQAVFFGFYLPVTGSYSNWNNFFDFWDIGNQDSAVWSPSLACNATWPDVGGHGVVCVGYDDTNNSWILLNSWGATPGRPDGTFRVTQNLNYSCTYSCDADVDVTVFQWQTLSPIFNSSIPAVTTGEAQVLSLSQAALFGNLSALGDSPAVSVSFEYGPTQNYGLTTPVRTMTAPGSFSATVSGLSPDITYHYRAKAVGDQVVYGPDMTFKTTPLPVPGSSNLTTALTIVALGLLVAGFLAFKARPKTG